METDSQTTVAAIGVVHSTRKEPIDDHWERERAEIELDARQFTDEALAGLASFSHVAHQSSGGVR